MADRTKSLDYDLILSLFFVTQSATIHTKWKKSSDCDKLPRLSVQCSKDDAGSILRNHVFDLETSNHSNFLS
ncbi:MAG: hypothetical protein JHD00_04675 [Akkermansiaceae bacterium]|nr:hypothetical protein [Akkermansiaceae bacterium]